MEYGATDVGGNKKQTDDHIDETDDDGWRELHISQASIRSPLAIRCTIKADGFITLTPSLGWRFTSWRSWRWRNDTNWRHELNNCLPPTYYEIAYSPHFTGSYGILIRKGSQKENTSNPIRGYSYPTTIKNPIPSQTKVRIIYLSLVL